MDRPAAAVAEPVERPQPPVRVEIPTLAIDAPALVYDPRIARPRLVGKYRGAWVIDKPAGWLVHPAAADPSPLLENWVQGELHPSGPVSPIHRLDKETSGLVLMSDRGDVRAEVSKIFAAHQVDKTYLALVHGRCHRKGIVRKPVIEDGKPLSATTRYRLLRWIGPYSLMVVRPAEGRKHQIRKHFAAIGHAVVGDARYGELRPWLGDETGRLMLHAFRLMFEDGHLVEAPLPHEFLHHLGRLLARYGA